MRVPYREFLQDLEVTAFSGIIEAFGAVYDPGTGGNIGFQPATGERSLATLKCRWSHYYVDNYGTPRIRMSAGQPGTTVKGVPLNDLTFLHHLPGCVRCQQGTEFGESLLRIGLGRPFSPGHERPESCWLQVNGIFPIQDEWPHFYQEPAL
jgi:hypothetical protein